MYALLGHDALFWALILVVDLTDALCLAWLAAWPGRAPGARVTLRTLAAFSGALAGFALFAVLVISGHLAV